MLKIAEIHTEEGYESFPVEADANWTDESRKLAHVPPLLILCAYIRDVRETDDLYEMLEAQWCRYCDFAQDNDNITDHEYDAALHLNNKTWEAIP